MAGWLVITDGRQDQIVSAAIETLRSEEEVGIAGDWHMNLKWALEALSAAHRAGITHILHVGDFGWWPRDRRGVNYLSSLNQRCIALGIHLYPLAGNHEDWETWDTAQPELTHIHLLSRTGLINVGGRAVAWMSGAASIDRDYRTRGVDWFPEELPTEADVQNISAVGDVDVLLTHEAPLIATTNVALGRINNPLGVPQHLREYSHVGAQRVQRVSEALNPELHAHGHWHTPESQQFAEAGSRCAHTVLSLGMDGQPMNLVRLRMSSLKWSPISVGRI